jgi:hypothetical protein
MLVFARRFRAAHPRLASTQLQASIVAKSLFSFGGKEWSRLPDYYMKDRTLEGFQSHHIVPVAAGGKRLTNPTAARAIAYLCGPYGDGNAHANWNANDAINGVELRGPKWRNNTADYARLLDANDKLLQYHPSLHTAAYYQWLVTNLRAAVPAGGHGCISAAQPQMYSMAQQLKVGGAPGGAG